MKLPVVLVFLLFITCHVKAQKILFSDISNRWRASGYVSSYQIYHQNYDWYYLPTTTTKNGHTYSMMLWFKSQKPDTFLIRDDIPAGKVHYTTLSDTAEHLLYDYTLKPGDSIYYGYSMHTVNSIDSTLINNVWYKVFKIDGELIIEGIGATDHPLFPVCPNCFHYYPLVWNGVFCFANKGSNPKLSPQIDNVNINWCIPTGSHDPRRMANTIKIYPQPASDLLTIDLPQHFSSGKLILVSSAGKVIYSAEFENERQLTIASQNWHGMYFYRIFNQDGAALSGKAMFE